MSKQVTYTSNNGLVFKGTLVKKTKTHYVVALAAPNVGEAHLPIDEGYVKLSTRKAKKKPAMTDDQFAEGAIQFLKQNRKKTTISVKGYTGTKKQCAMNIYNNVDGNRKMCIEGFMGQLGMTEAGARTYYYNCKKESV